MELNPCGVPLCAIIDIVLFCGTAVDVRFFFHATILTIHDTLLTARGTLVYFVSVFFFAMVSHAVATM